MSSIKGDVNNEWDSIIDGLDQDKISGRSEEQKKKRNSFLTDLDSFSNDFEMQSKHQNLLQINNNSLLSRMRQESSLFEAPSSQLLNINADIPTLISPTEENSAIQDSLKINEPKNQDDGFTKLSSSLFNETIQPKVNKRSPSSSSTNKISTEIPINNFIDDAKEDTDTQYNNNLGNFLTVDEKKRLTVEEIAAWRCKQDDLTTKRKDYHGAVTYAFGGIFGWEMYGSVESIDDTGRSYTEYLMRCQYGTTWTNMQPFICGRRFSEFEILHYEIANSFPDLVSSLPPFPEKDFFRFLAPEVIQKRRFMIEAYMSTIVRSLPSIVRSPIFMEFLNLSRIEFIRRSIGISSTSTIVNINNESNQLTADYLHDLDWTLDKAEAYRLETNAHALDDNELGRLEECLRELGRLWKLEYPIHNVIHSSSIKSLIHDIIKKWPNLRATAALIESTEVNFTLIPRALQVEEDFINYLNEYRSIKAAYS